MVKDLGPCSRRTSPDEQPYQIPIRLLHTFRQKHPSMPVRAFDVNLIHEQIANLFGGRRRSFYLLHRHQSSRRVANCRFSEGSLPALNGGKDTYSLLLSNQGPITER